MYIPRLLSLDDLIIPNPLGYTVTVRTASPQTLKPNAIKMAQRLESLPSSTSPWLHVLLVLLCVPSLPITQTWVSNEWVITSSQAMTASHRASENIRYLCDLISLFSLGDVGQPAAHSDSTSSYALSLLNHEASPRPRLVHTIPNVKMKKPPFLVNLSAYDEGAIFADPMQPCDPMGDLRPTPLDLE